MALTFNSVDPRTGEPGPSYEEASPEDVRAAVEAATAVHRSGALRDRAKRVALLRGAAARLRAAGDEIIPVCEAETGLPEVPRLRSELERTCGQLEAFAAIVEAGDDAEAIIDHPDPDAKPIPKPDVRRMRVPLGPVAVFGASNFPLAFSTAGGDTASALAAGCPVIVKGHPSHPGTGELVARELSAAVADAGLPEGTFAHLPAAGVEVGEALVDAPEIAAVGFTGSFNGRQGDLRPRGAAGGADPRLRRDGLDQPDRGHRGGAARARREDRRGPDRLGRQLRRPALHQAGRGVRAGGRGGRRVRRRPGRAARRRRPAGAAQRAPARRAARRRGPAGGSRAAARRGRGGRTARASATSRPPTRRPRRQLGPELLEEHFGPVVLLLRHGSREELLAALDQIDGQLTGSVHAQPGEDVADVVAALGERAGRVVFNGFPTGVAVTFGMHHGGPYPATTSPLHTSVGMTATDRFTRPIAFQDAPAEALPPELREENPLGIRRRIDGGFEPAQ